MTPSTAVEHVRVNTQGLRTATDPIYVRLRALLEQRRIDPYTTFVVWFYPDDPAAYFGVIVTANCAVYEFWFDYAQGAEAGTFTEWDDWTENAERERDPYLSCALNCAFWRAGAVETTLAATSLP